jgi:hypothetical protein
MGPVRERRAFVGDRNERRDITAGQRAMAYALLFPKGKRTGRGNKVLPKSKTLGVASEGYADKLVSQARAVLEYSRPWADEVRDGETAQGLRFSRRPLAVAAHLASSCALPIPELFAHAAAHQRRRNDRVVQPGRAD